MRHAIATVTRLFSVVLPGLIISISLCQASPLANASPDSLSRLALRGIVDAGAFQPAVTVSGEMKKWHPVTVTLEGPAASERATTTSDEISCN